MLILGFDNVLLGNVVFLWSVYYNTTVQVFILVLVVLKTYKTNVVAKHESTKNFTLRKKMRNVLVI